MCRVFCDFLIDKNEIQKILQNVSSEINNGMFRDSISIAIWAYIFTESNDTERNCARLQFFCVIFFISFRKNNEKNESINKKYEVEKNYEKQISTKDKREKQNNNEAGEETIVM